MSVPQSPETGQPQEQPRRRGWLMAVLVVSLALNLFVIGAIAAQHMGWRDGDRRVGRMIGPGFTQLLPRRFFFEISNDRRHELRTLMRGHRGEFRDGRNELRLAARSVADALAAEPFDQARLDAALQTFAAGGHSLIDIGVKVAREVVSGLTAEERKLLAKQLLRRSMGTAKQSDKKKAE
jgi:uncharacterized membrane protein